MDILETFDFVHHFDKPTHNSGHLLDYIITRKDTSGVSNLYLSDFINLRYSSTPSRMDIIAAERGGGKLCLDGFMYNVKYEIEN